MNEAQKIIRPSGLRLKTAIAVRRLMSWKKIRGYGRLSILIARLILPRGKCALPMSTGKEMVLDLSNPGEVHMFFELFDDYAWTVKELLRPGDVFIDLGANLGYFSFLASPLVGGAGRVLAVDANPAMVERLRETIETCGHDRVKALNLAVSDSPGVVKLNIACEHFYSSLADVGRLPWTGKSGEVEVESATLDSLLEGELGDGRVRLVKIDVEGAEVEVLRGAEKSLSSARVDYFFIEFHRHQSGLLGHTLEDMMELLRRHGYEAVEYGDLHKYYLCTSPRVLAQK